jgi:hypothetical protein
MVNVITREELNRVYHTVSQRREVFVRNGFHMPADGCQLLTHIYMDQVSYSYIITLYSYRLESIGAHGIARILTGPMVI